MIFYILGHLSTSKHILVILICNVGEAFTFSGICGLMSLRIHDWVLNVSTRGDAWDKKLLDSAKGSQIFSKTSREKTVEDLVSQAFKSYLRGTDAIYNREVVKALAEVQLEDMKALSQGLLSTFLSPETSRIVVVCSPHTVKEIVTDFQDMGFQLKTYNHLEETFLNEDI